MAKSLNQSLERALDLLEILRDSESSMRCVDLARALDLAPNTANNMVRTLFRRGYLQQDVNGLYQLGPQCYFLGKTSDYLEYLRFVAMPVMMDFSKKSAGNAFLGIERNAQLFMAVHLEGPAVIRVFENQDWRERFHCSAVGKIILAEKGFDWFRMINNGEPLQKISSRTILNLKELESNISNVKKNGYSICDREGNEELFAIAVPIHCREGGFIGGLGQSFPYYYVEKGKINVEERISMLNETARLIGDRHSRFIKQAKAPKS